MDDKRLAFLKALCGAATPGPWYPQHTDDDYCMNAYFVSATEDPQWDRGNGMDPSECESGDVVAITFLQHPRLCDVEDTLWSENTRFIAEARAGMPELIAEVEFQQGWVQRLQNTVLENIEEIQTLKARVAQLHQEHEETLAAWAQDLDRLEERVAELQADAALGRTVRGLPVGAMIAHAGEPLAEWIVDWPTPEKGKLWMHRHYGDTSEAALEAARVAEMGAGKTDS